MATDSKACLPATEDKWRNEARSHDVISIHEFKDRDSGSKMTVLQYLALKTIWKGYDPNDIIKDEWALRFGSTEMELLEQSTKMSEDDAWRTYLNILETTPKPKPHSNFPRKLGRFATVVQNQLEVSNLKPTERELQKVIVSPISGRTRLRAKSVQPVPFVRPVSTNISQGDSNSSEREGRAREAEERPGLRAVSQISDHASVSSVIDFDIPRRERDVTIDEQVVNTAAINFLQNLFVHGGLEYAYWSAQRKGFCLGNGSRGSTAFKAFTDGHLKVKRGDEIRSAAILEVKARKRPTRDDFSVEWQETAQMALWIYEEPSSYWTSKTDRSICQ